MRWHIEGVGISKHYSKEWSSLVQGLAENEKKSFPIQINFRCLCGVRVWHAAHSMAVTWAGLLWSQNLCSLWFFGFSKPWEALWVWCLERCARIVHCAVFNLGLRILCGHWENSLILPFWNKSEWSNFTFKVLKGYSKSYFLTWWSRNWWARGSHLSCTRPWCSALHTRLYTIWLMQDRKG